MMDEKIAEAEALANKWIRAEQVTARSSVSTLAEHVLALATALREALADHDAERAAKDQFTPFDIGRFFRFVEVTTSCWNWSGARAAKRYGCFYLNGKRERAHVISYILHHGVVPTGLDVDHLCRNRLCVNPDHLEAVTRRENLLRGIAARTAAVCKNGHARTAANSKKSTTGIACKICSRDYNRSYRARIKADVSAASANAHVAAWRKEYGK